MEKQLYPPKDWQNFELLCLKLWEQLWEVPNEVDFNSTNQQGQNGVDIVGIPKNENTYFGIQCKNKVLHYRHGEKNKLRKLDLLKEIEKAKTFKPKLSKLIIATSLYRDKEIEEFIREQNENNLKNGFFSIQICFWDYISRNIQEIESVFNWYLGKESKRTRFSIDVSFDSGKKELTYFPKFVKTKINYRVQTEEERIEEKQHFEEMLGSIFDKKRKTNSFYKPLRNFIDSFPTFSKYNSPDGQVKVTINGEDIGERYPREKLNLDSQLGKTNNPLIGYIEDEQKLKFQVKLFNNGTEVIQDYKIKFKVKGNIEKFEVISCTILQSLNNTYPNDTYVNDLSGIIQPDNNFLVQLDHFYSNFLLLSPQKESNERIIITWELLSRNFHDEGELIINVYPKHIEKEKVMYVKNDYEACTVFEYSNEMVVGTIGINF